jgi:uncharacterized membrane protein
MSDNRQILPPLLLVTGIAAVVRGFRLGTRDLWLDEALSLHFATTYTSTELLFRLPLTDPHPPLYYLLLRGWTALFGTSAVSGRTLSAVLGVAAVILLFCLVRDLFDTQTAALAALILAVAPFQIIHAQNIRMYPLTAFLTVGSIYCLRRLRGGWTWFWTTAYIGSTLLLGYTHVYGLFIIAAQNLSVLSRYYRFSAITDISPKRWAILQTVLGVLLLPWGAVLLRRVSLPAAESALSWLTQPTPVEVLVTPFWWMHSGFATGIGVIELVPPALVAMAGLGGMLRRRSERLQAVTVSTDAEAVRFLVLWMAVPVVLAAVISHLLRPVFLWRATIVAAPAYYILIARGITCFHSAHHRYILITLQTVGMVVPLGAYYQAGDREAWRAVAADTASAVESDEAIVISDDYTQVPFNQYWNRADTPVFTVAEQPGTEVGINAVYPRISARAVQQLNRSGIWLVLAHINTDHRRRLVTTLEKRYTRVEQNQYRSPDWTVHPPITVMHFTDRQASGVGRQP